MEKLTLSHTSFSALPGWAADDHAQALAAFLISCDALVKKSDDAAYGKDLLAAKAAIWKEICAEASATPPEHARAFFESAFTPFRAGADGREDGLFTGYYEPLLTASLKRDPRFPVPIYGPPPELGKEPFLTRADINRGALANRRLEIAWTDDPVALFFAEIQGSARLRLPDGSERRIGFAGKNNQPYLAIGKVLRERGELPEDEVNLFTIRNWLILNPAQAREVMEQNASFVFFRFVEGQNAIGAQGVPLTPGRSLAVDYRYLPYGIPVFLQSSLPQTAYNPAQPLSRLFIAQDTGGAIRGPVRGDIFFGPGAQAEALAGLMKGRGTYVLLAPNAIAANIP